MNELRKDLESYAVAWNTPLRDVVSSMSNVILLRCSHPSYRDSFARLLLDKGMISKEQGGEFIKMVGR